MKWYYQFTPHDELDYDSTQVPVLVDIEWQGRPRKVMLWANRNGLAYVLDRISGEFLLGKPFVKVNWTNGFDKNGRPVPRAWQGAHARRFVYHAHVSRRDQLGGAIVQPNTGLFYVPAWENTALIAIEGQAPRIPGVGGTGSVPLTPGIRQAPGLQWRPWRCSPRPGP